MGTNYIAPIWRMPKNANKDKLSNYSIDFDFGDWMELEVAADPLPIFTPQDKKFSISLWMKTADATPSANSYLFSTMSAGGATKMGLYLDTSGNINWKVYSGSPQKTITSTATLSDNTWYHIVGTWDGSTINLYIDGTSAATPVAATDAYTPTSSNTFATLGAYRYQTSGTSRGGYYTGELAQVSVWNSVALSEDQINYLYNKNNPMVPGNVNLPTPIAYYPLGDNSNPNATAGYPNISVGADSVFDFENGDVNFIKAFDVPVTTFTEASISAWVNFESVGGTFQYVVGMGSGPGNFMSISKYEFSGPFYTYDGSGVKQCAISPVANKWYHVVVTQTGTVRRFYINGVEDANSPFTCNALAIPHDNLTIGAYNNQPPASTPASPLYRLDGRLSNVQVWDTALALSDVKDLYNNGQPLMTSTQPQEANLQAWYKLNQTETWDEGVAPFSVEKVGSPDYTNAGDGCFTTSGVLRWQDTGDQLLSSGNYFTYLSPVIYASAQDVDLITTGGSYQTGSSSQLEYALEYSVDGGTWTTWKTEVVPTFTGLTNWTVANVNNLNVDRSIQIRLRATGGLFGTEQFNFNDIRINVNGHKSYEETFGTANKGWLNGAYDPPTDYWKTPEWIISDASAPYQKSMNINAVGSTYISDRFNSYEGPRGMNTNVGTYSCWVNLDTLDSQVFMDVPGYASREFLNFRIRSNGALQMEMRSWSTHMLWDTVSTTPLTAGKWHHIVAVGDGSNVIFYIDGQLEPSYLATGSYRWWNTFATLSYPNVGHRIYLGSGTYPTRHSPMNGRISNAQIWNTNLNSAQILDLYNNGKPLQGTQPAAENLLAWYKLDENDSSWINYNYNNNILVNKWNVKNSATPTPTSTEALNLSGNSQDGFKEGFEISDTSVNGSITLSVWYKATGSGIKIFDFESSGSIPYASVRFNSDDIYIYSNDNSSRAEGAGRINLSYSWTNVIIHIPNTSPTFDATQIRWWQNGVEEPTLSVIGSTTWNAFQEVRGLNVGSTSTSYAGLGYQFSNWAWFEDLTINDANIETIYNSGTPGDLSTLNPKAWYKLDSTDITFGSSGPKTSALSITDSSSNGNNATGPYDYDLATGPQYRPTIAPGDVQESIVGNNMTEGQLQRPAVSALNGESSGMNTTNLVQSNLTRKQPYSNYSFNFGGGINEYILTSFAPASYTSFSISAWAYADSLGSFNVVASQYRNGNPANSAWFLETIGSNMAFGIANGAGAPVYATKAFSTLTWHHIVGVWNGTEVEVYIDGVPSGSPQSRSGMNTGTVDMAIGALWDSTGTSIGAGAWDGKISNISLFDNALTQDDIINLYNNGIPQDLSNFRITPIAWWPMDEHSSYYDGTDWVVRDLINGNDGDGANTGNVDDLVGNAPGSEVSGIGTNLTIADLKGNMESSKENAYSINMADYADGVTNPANSGRSTEVPSV